MQFIIYVVKTKIRFYNRTAKRQLETVKREIIHEYRGFTILKRGLGFWIDDKGKLETDKIELWIILLKTGDLETETTIIEDFSKRIKTITKQNCQLFQINENPYFC